MPRERRRRRVGRVGTSKLLVVAGVLGFYAEGASFTQSQTRSVWDGVFTEEQAARGQVAYTEACTSCHRDDLSGNEDGAPPLRGAAFLGRWMGRTLSEFSFVLSETMPQDAPNSLTMRQYVDIVGFILRSNGAPVGKTELPDDPETLEHIRFTPAPFDSFPARAGNSLRPGRWQY